MVACLVPVDITGTSSMAIAMTAALAVAGSGVAGVRLADDLHQYRRRGGICQLNGRLVIAKREHAMDWNAYIPRQAQRKEQPRFGYFEDPQERAEHQANIQQEPSALDVLAVQHQLALHTGKVAVGGKIDL